MSLYNDNNIFNNDSICGIIDSQSTTTFLKCDKTKKKKKNPSEYYYMRIF